MLEPYHRLPSLLTQRSYRSGCLHTDVSIAYARAGMLSEDGRCKTFDTSANGYVRIRRARPTSSGWTPCPSAAAMRRHAGPVHWERIHVPCALGAHTCAMCTGSAYMGHVPSRYVDSRHMHDHHLHAHHRRRCAVRVWAASSWRPSRARPRVRPRVRLLLLSMGPPWLDAQSDRMVRAPA